MDRNFALGTSASVADEEQMILNNPHLKRLLN